MTAGHSPDGALLEMRRPSPSVNGVGKPAVRRPRPIRELLLIAVLWSAYSLGRIAANHNVASAFDNAHRVWRLEHLMHLPNEMWLQRVIMAHEVLARSANIYYASVHFSSTALFLLWMYLRRPTHYLWVRRTLAILTATGFVVHVLLPLAPPRMLAETHLVDTAQLYGPAVYGSPESDALANQYAAMPSLHVGWAVMVAIGLIVTTRSAWRWLFLLHPAMTIFVVVSTANHYWLDGIVAGLLLVGALAVVPPPAAPWRGEQRSRKIVTASGKLLPLTRTAPARARQ